MTKGLKGQTGQKGQKGQKNKIGSTQVIGEEGERWALT